MVRTKRIFLLVGMMIALLTTQCTPASQPTVTATAAPEEQTPTSAPITATPAVRLVDGLGRSVELAAPAQRIVSLAPSNTEILFALGAGSQVIARDDFSDYPEEVKALPSITTNLSDINIEQIVLLKPDLVLATEINTPEQVKALEDVHITVFYLPNPVDLEGLYENLETVAELTGKQDVAEKMIPALRNRIQTVEDRLKDVETRPVVYVELDGTDPAKPWTTGPGTFQALIIDMAGGKNAGDEMRSEWAQISQEELIVKNPDFMLVDAVWGTTLEQVVQRPGWQALKAVQNKQVVPMDFNLFSRPTPRLVDAVEMLAKLLHPEVFN
jgi:iron complex transport system substrate-binding protein